MKRAALVLIALGLIASTEHGGFASAAGRTPGRPAQRIAAAPVCVRQTVSLSNLPAELMKIQGSCVTVAACAFSLSNFQQINIGKNPYLYYGSSSHLFAPAQQNQLMADANMRAQAARPSQKILVSISYFQSTTGGTGLLDANALYAVCGPEANPN